MSPLAWVVVIVFAVALLAGLETAGWAFLVGRYKRRREFTNLITELPPVPDTDRDWLSVPPLEFDAVEPDDDADWFASWACDTPLSVIEAAYWHKEFLRIPEVAADLGLTS